jgi:hypothetical protein
VRVARSHFDADPNYNGAGSSRGRSPGVKGKGKEGLYGQQGRAASATTSRRGVSTGSTSGGGVYSSSQFPYAGSSTSHTPSDAYLSVPGPSTAPYSTGRSSSLSPPLPPPPVPSVSAAVNAYAPVPNPSPLARSFSASGEMKLERDARTRTPSGLSTMSAL